MKDENIQMQNIFNLFDKITVIGCPLEPRDGEVSLKLVSAKVDNFFEHSFKASIIEVYDKI